MSEFKRNNLINKNKEEAVSKQESISKQEIIKEDPLSSLTKFKPNSEVIKSESIKQEDLLKSITGNTYNDVKKSPEEIIKNLSIHTPENKMNQLTKYIQNSEPKDKKESSSKNILENVQISELKAMISNALRFHNSVNNNIIKDMTVYSLTLKFVADRNAIAINDLSITERFDECVAPESSMEEKYNEYNQLMSTYVKKVGTTEKIINFLRI